MSWFAVSGLPGRHGIVEVAFDPVRPSTIYAAGGGLFKSEDGGESWSMISHRLENRQIRSLSFDPRDSSVLYVGTDLGVFRSSNGGFSWVETNRGLPIGTSRQFYVLDVVAHPAIPGTLYAGTDSPGGLFKSTDAGESWRLVAPGRVNAILLSPSDPSLLYAGTARGVWKSTDGGETWRDTFDLGADPQIESVSPSPLRLVTESPSAQRISYGIFVKGRGFLPGSTIHFNGTERRTFMSSCTRLSALIPSSDIRGPGTAIVTVVNPPPDSAVSLPFYIEIQRSDFRREPPARRPREPRVLNRDSSQGIQSNKVFDRQ